MNLGKSFSDFVIKGKGSRSRKTVSKMLAASKSVYDWRVVILFVVLIAAFILLEARLFHLTIVFGSRNRLLSEANRTREEMLAAARGIIFDNNGTPLVHNVPFYILQEENCQQAGLCQRLSLNEVKEKGLSLDDERLQMIIGREYPLASAAAHLLGYIGEINKEELRKFNKGCGENPYCRYRPGEFVGRGGIEQFYDQQLRGTPGRELVEVDALGNKLRTLARIEPIKGENINLSIDIQLQKFAAQLLADKAGVIIVSSPESEILALVSSPSFDPNLFVSGSSEVEKIINREDQPLFNRAISGVYPPGSTFKLVTAIAALEEGKINAETEFEDTGVITIGPYRFPNWYFLQYGKVDGMVNIVKAISRSNDIFFYHTGQLVGIENLAKWAGTVGVGRELGIDLPGEQAGLMPDPKWKKEAMGESWYLGDTYHIAIGQGHLLVTPLQVNVWTNLIANNGKLCQPTVKKRTNDKSADVQQRILCADIGLHQETIRLIKEGMTKACQPGGTGWPLFNFKVKNEKIKIDQRDFLATAEATMSGQPLVKIPVACKTGTAEYGDPQQRTHAWFTAFAPVENPEIVVTVLVEAGGEGSYVAAPLAKQILQFWFENIKS